MVDLASGDGRECAGRRLPGAAGARRGVGTLGTRARGAQRARPEAGARTMAAFDRPDGDRSGTLTQGEIFFVSESSSRSEEHTSELQSLMRISYAVFCLKQNK